MAQLPVMFINISEVQHQLLELEEENLRLKQQLKDMEELIQYIQNEVQSPSSKRKTDRTE